MYHSNSSKLPTPDELHTTYGVKFFVTHIHDGNDESGARRAEFAGGKKAPIYVTTCLITNWDKSIELGYGEALCSHKDTPNRRLGHEIAVSRAIKDFLNNTPKEELTELSLGQSIRLKEDSLIKELLKRDAG